MRTAFESELNECLASDAELVVGLRRGDPLALAQLHARHGGVVYATAHRLCGRDGAEDVAQEVFLRLWRAPEVFDPGRGSLRSLLLAQTHSRAVDRNRGEAARRAREQVVGIRHCSRAVDVDVFALDVCIGERVRSALGALCEAEREAIVLAYFGGHSYQEVATLLRQPEGTVKSRIRRGLARLSATLSVAGDELRFG